MMIISRNKTDGNDFVGFLKKEFHDQKIDKNFINNFYQILVENVPDFPKIDEKNPTKKNLVNHLNQNFLSFQEFYFDALNYI